MLFPLDQSCSNLFCDLFQSVALPCKKVKGNLSLTSKTSKGEDVGIRWDFQSSDGINMVLLCQPLREELVEDKLLPTPAQHDLDPIPNKNSGRLESELGWIKIWRSVCVCVCVCDEKL